MRLRAAFPIVAVALEVVATNAAAQRITITPTVGAYVSLKSQPHWERSECGDRGPPCVWTYFQTAIQRTPALGMRLGVEWDGGIGFELMVMTVQGERRTTHAVRMEGEATPLETIEEVRPVRNTVSAFRLTLARPVGARADFTLGAGLASTALGGEAYDGIFGVAGHDRTLLSPTVAVQFVARPTARTRVQVGLSNAFYRVEFRSRDTLEPSTSQHDLVISAGLGLVLGR